MADDDADDAAVGGDGKGGVKIGKKQVKNEHVLIIIGVLTLIITYVFLRRTSAGNTASNTQSVGGSSGTASNPQYEQDLNGLADDLSQMQQEIVGLQAGYAGTTATSTTTPTGYTPPVPTADTQPIGTQNLTTEVQQGAGYWGGTAANTAPIQTAGGQVFDYLPSWAQAQQDIQEDIPVYYQSSPGVFSQAFNGSGNAATLVPALTQPGQAPTPLFVGGGT